TRQEACDRFAEGREAVIVLGPQAVHDETEALARFALSAPLHIAAGGAETGRPGQRQNVEIELPGGTSPRFAKGLREAGHAGEAGDGGHDKRPRPCPQDSVLKAASSRLRLLAMGGVGVLPVETGDATFGTTTDATEDDII